MKIGFVIYDAMTGLDFVGVFDPMSRLKTMGFLPDLEWDICALREEITDGAGLRFRATRVKQSLGGYDAVVVPGGPAAVQLRFDNDFVDWIKTAESCSWKISVCSGALLLGAAGFLKGKKATTHPTRKTELADY